MCLIHLMYLMFNLCDVFNIFNVWDVFNIFLITRVCWCLKNDHIVYSWLFGLFSDVDDINTQINWRTCQTRLKQHYRWLFFNYVKSVSWKGESVVWIKPLDRFSSKWTDDIVQKASTRLALLSLHSSTEIYLFPYFSGNSIKKLIYI